MPATFGFHLTSRRQQDTRKFVFTLADSTPFVIGRSLTSDFPIDDPSISRQHCQLYLEQNELFVEDLSKNGTFINSAPLRGRTQLSESDVLRMGECELKVQQQLSEMIKDKELVGREFHGYEVQSVVGAGNTGVLYRGIQKSINRTVAIKTLSHRHLANPSAIEHFLKVPRLAGLLAHPNIVQVFDSGQLEQYGLYYIVMEFVEGETLAQKLARQSVMPFKQAAHYMIQIGSALQFGHRKRIIHRDVNPVNIMITESGMAKLAGLGLAKSLDGEISQVTMGRGEMDLLDYIAPEQVVDLTAVDHRTDIFGLGSVFYRLVTGKPPLEFEGRDNYLAHLESNDAPPPAHEVNADVPKEVSNLIQRALRYAPEKRFQSMEQMVDALQLLIRPRVIDTLRMRRARQNILAMLPDPPDVAGYRFGVLFNPCEELGGDFYDFFQVGNANHLGLLVGDVSGHGIEAAVIVGMAKTMSRLFARQYDTTAQALRAVNQEILPDLDNTTFVTIFLAVIDPVEKTLRFSRGGHNPLILFNAEREEPLQVLAPPGTVIGMVPDNHFVQEEATLQLQSGDLLLAYTDGVVEAMNHEEEFFDTNRLEELVRSYQPGQALNPLLDQIYHAVTEWRGSDILEDDITLMAIAVE